MKVLITGIAGGLAREVARRLVQSGDEVVGADYRRIPEPSGDLTKVPVYRAHYHKTAIEDVFRQGPFDAVLHLGRVGNLSERIDKRFDLNVVGSKKVLSLARSHGAKRLVVLSARLDGRRMGLPPPGDRDRGLAPHERGRPGHPEHDVPSLALLTRAEARRFQSDDPIRPRR
jgi:nucleoside-diphosphate-sugar epimerase